MAATVEWAAWAGAWASSPASQPKRTEEAPICSDRWGPLFVQTLELKQSGEKLTGTITGRENQKVEIKDGTFKNDEISFTVVRSRDGQEFKTVYKGKVEGDTIKGKTTFTREGQERSRDWNATRVK